MPFPIPFSRRLGIATGMLSLCLAAPASMIELENPVSQARLTFADGIRLASFQLLDQPNVLRESSASTRGLKTWIMAPADLLHVRDSLSEEPAEAEQLSPMTARLWMLEPNDQGLRLEWEVTLDPQEAKLTVVHRVHSVSEFPLHLSVWALAALDPSNLIIAPFPESSALPATYPVPIHFFRMTSLDDPRLELTDDALLVDLRERDPSNNLKFGLLQPAGVLYAETPQTRTRFQVDYDPMGTYPEGGANVTVFASPNREGEGFGEIEHMSPLFLLRPGESVSLTQEITLESLDTEPKPREGL